MFRWFGKSEPADTPEEMYEACMVSKEIGQATGLSKDYMVAFVHTRGWLSGKYVSPDKPIPYRPVRSETLQTVAQLARAIKKEYRDFGLTAQIIGPDGVVSGRTRL